MKSAEFSNLVEVYAQLEHITSGNAIRSLLSKLFKSVSKSDLDKAAFLTLGRIVPEYVDINLGVAEKMVLRAISAASKTSLRDVDKVYKQLGDAGLAAEKFVSRRKKNLSVGEVFDSLHDIAESSGSGSQEKKMKILSKLFQDASPSEARYIARIVLGKLRLGVGDMTVLDSLAIAFADSKEAKKQLKFAYNVCPDIGIIARTIAVKGMNGIKKIAPVIGLPIQMMLAQRVVDFESIAEKISGKISAEEKYDGERVQAHKNGSRIVLYSRKLENITLEFPEIVDEIKKNVRAKKCIIEGECVAVDTRGNLLPFQVLMQRKRKYDVEKYVQKVPVCFYVFDILDFNGKSLINESYPVRRALIEKIVSQTKKLQLAKRVVSENLDDIEDFFNATIERGGEGIIAKSCGKDSIYTPGKRGWLWIKWKREYAKKLADTFDFVVVGAFFGRGKRGGTYGALLCAAYNPVKDVFETVCKLGSGFSDAELAQLPKNFKNYVVKTKPARVVVNKSLFPDVWFEPKIVVEVIGAELTRSPIHTSAIKDGKGLALRFPRFVRFRGEKSAEQATTDKELLGIAK